MKSINKIEINFLSLVKFIKSKLMFFFITSAITITILISSFSVQITEGFVAQGSFIISKTINETLLNTAKEMALSKPVLSDALQKVRVINDQIEGQKVNVNVLMNNLEVRYSTASPAINVTFTYKDRELTKQILNSIIETAVDYGNEQYYVFESSLAVGKLSNDASSEGANLLLFRQLVAITSVAFFLLTTLLAFVFSSKVHFTGSFVFESVFLKNVFSLNIKRRKYRYISKDIFDKIDCFSGEKNTILGFITTSHGKTRDFISQILLDKYSDNETKVLVLNTVPMINNFEQPSMSLIHKENMERKKNYLSGSKDYINYSSLLENVKTVREVKKKKIVDKILLFKNEYDKIVIIFDSLLNENLFLFLSSVLDNVIINIVYEETPKNTLDYIFEDIKTIDKSKIHINLWDNT